MKKKLFSFLLAICLIIPCWVMLTACGNNPPENSHTHNWSATWSKNSTEHWLTCDGCDEKKDKDNHNYGTDTICDICGYDADHIHSWSETYTYDEEGHWKNCLGCSEKTSKTPHDYENKTCVDCGYYNPNADLPVVNAVRDLEVITYDVGISGLFTLVKLPDGKNMVIDSGNTTFDCNLIVEDTLMYAQGLATIDYFVLTNTNNARTGQASYIMQSFEVLNLYTPRVIGSAPSCYTNALALAPNTCNVVEVAESNCDIFNEFKKSGSNTTYSYTIDFMLPATTADCIYDYDASIAMTIEYQGKTILITGDNSQINIKGYIDNYDGQKDVDVLICSFVAADPYAITNAPSFAGKDYFESISLESGDYAIISPLSSDSRVDVLKATAAGICGWDKVYLLTDSNNLYTAYVTINSSGNITVTAD